MKRPGLAFKLRSQGQSHYNPRYCSYCYGNMTGTRKYIHLKCMRAASNEIAGRGKIQV